MTTADLWLARARPATDPLAGAVELIRAGVPVFVAPPDPARPTGYRLPADWQHTEPDPAALGRWRQGWAVCAVMGHTLDVLDVDPRNGGDESLAALTEAGLIPRVYAETATPSGGRHLFIAARGLAKATPWPGVDYQAGTRDGRGRGFVFVPPTARVPKGRPDAGAVLYVWTAPPDAEHITTEAPDDDTGAELARLVREAHGASNGQAAPGDLVTVTASPWADVAATLRRGRHTGVVALAASLRGRGGWREGDALAYMRAVVWPFIDQAQAGHAYTMAELQDAVRDVFTRYPDGHDEPAGGPQALAEFWQARDSLATIHQHARAVRVGPWALLGRVLALVVAHTPPGVRLPALVGAPGSLNLFVALVGPSGSGKGIAAAAADAVLAPRAEWGETPTCVTPGSGEGIASAYMHRVRVGAGKTETGQRKTETEVKQHTVCVLFDAPEVDTLTALTERRGTTLSPEVDTLTALTERRGTTLSPELRRAWSGEALGFQYRDPATRLPVPAHDYRMALVLGVQPERAGALLRDADGGTPQRFTWLPVTDPDAPDVPPPVPAPLGWALPARPKLWPHVMGVCATARAEVDAHRLTRLRGGQDDDTLNGHALLARLKIAAALALLDHRLDVDDEDWHLAGVVMAVSDHTREQVQGSLAAATRRADEHAADRQARRETRVEENHVQRVARWAVTWLTEHGPSNGADIRRACPSRNRSFLDEALERAQDAGQVRGEDIAGQGTPGKRWTATGGHS